MITYTHTRQKPGFSLAGHELAQVKTRFLQPGRIDTNRFSLALVNLIHLDYMNSNNKGTRKITNMNKAMLRLFRVTMLTKANNNLS